VLRQGGFGCTRSIKSLAAQSILCTSVLVERVDVGLVADVAQPGQIFSESTVPLASRSMRLDSRTNYLS
jgi:hypothetical protein